MDFNFKKTNSNIQTPSPTKATDRMSTQLIQTIKKQQEITTPNKIRQETELKTKSVNQNKGIENLQNLNTSVSEDKYDDLYLLDYLTVDEAAAFAKVSKHTIRNWTQKKLVKSIKVRGKFGQETRVSKPELILYLALLGNVNTSYEDNDKNISSSDVLVTEYIEALKKALETANKHLAEKDSQISLLLEKLTQANTLALNAQNIALNFQEEKKSLNGEILKLQQTSSKRKKFLGLF
jgi:excisionase family DNA binding protein